MKCPNCQAPEKVRVRHCTSCGVAYSTEDLLELRQLEYLLGETAEWEGVDSYRTSYQTKLNTLKKRLISQKAEVAGSDQSQELASVPDHAPELISTAAGSAAAISRSTAGKTSAQPGVTKEKGSFDQWLLSERNIKIALYSGAVLLVLAGIIFIGVNWARFSGGVKFAITSLVTALTYFGGYLFFKRPTLRLGGNALLSIACGFFALNFGVLQIYVLEPRGLPNDVMWLITSPLCLILYFFTAYWTQSELFTYFSIAAAGSTLAAALFVANAPVLAFILAFSILLTFFWSLSRWLKNNSMAQLTVTPLSWISQILMPVVNLFAIAGWFMETGCEQCTNGSPFLPILSMSFGVLFYIFTEVSTKRRIVRWISSLLLTLTLGFSMAELDFGQTAMGVGLMLQALAYIWAGYWLNQKTGEGNQDYSLYVVSYIVAGYLTFTTLISSSNELNLILVLIGDVLLLGTTSFIRRSYRWLYGAAWLAIFPVYLLANMHISEMQYQGLVMFGFGFLNFGTGYLIGRRNLKWGGAFLTAAAVLSAVSVIMTFGNLTFASIVLLIWFILYLLTAVWLKWAWLLVPALGALNLAAVTLNIEFISKSSRAEMLTISYAGLGVLCWIIGRRLSRLEEKDWTWPLYILGFLDLFGAFMASIELRGWLAVGVSLTLGALFLVYASLKGSKFIERIFFEALPYMGVTILFISQFFLIGELNLNKFWPAITVGVCGLFAAIAWLLSGKKFGAVYELPFRLGGLALMIVPLIGSLIINTAWITALVFIVCGAVCLVDAGLRRLRWMAFPGVFILYIAHFFLRKTIWPEENKYWMLIAASGCVLLIIVSWLLREKKLEQIFYLPFRLGGLVLAAIPLSGMFVYVYRSGAYLQWAFTFGIVGAMYLGDAAIHRSPRLGYLGLLSFVAAVWAGLIHFDVQELQAYVFPIGLVLIGVGWFERVRYQKGLYQLFTWVGCIIMLGTAFYQSIPREAWEYALLVGIESIIAIFWGIRTKSRGYVQVGGITLISNALVQFIPSFLEWSRWMQIGLTGSILLGLGLVALFQREKLLETRKKLTTEWQSWSP